MDGGNGDGRNDMEYLMTTGHFGYDDCSVCKDKLPCSIYDHEMNTLQKQNPSNGKGY
jgi:hypothetical protein